jgi:hypothetical protein
VPRYVPWGKVVRKPKLIFSQVAVMKERRSEKRAMFCPALYEYRSNLEIIVSIQNNKRELLCAVSLELLQLAEDPVLPVLDQIRAMDEQVFALAQRQQGSIRSSVSGLLENFVSQSRADAKTLTEKIEKIHASSEVVVILIP